MEVVKKKPTLFFIMLATKPVYLDNHAFSNIKELLKYYDTFARSEFLIHFQYPSLHSP